MILETKPTSPQLLRVVSAESFHANEQQRVVRKSPLLTTKEQFLVVTCSSIGGETSPAKTDPFPTNLVRPLFETGNIAAGVSFSVEPDEGLPSRPEAALKLSSKPLMNLRTLSAGKCSFLHFCVYDTAIVGKTESTERGNRDRKADFDFAK